MGNLRLPGGITGGLLYPGLGEGDGDHRLAFGGKVGVPGVLRGHFQRRVEQHKGGGDGQSGHQQTAEAPASAALPTAPLGSYLSLRNAGQSRRSGVEVEPRPVLHQRHIALAQLAHIEADEAVEKLIF